MGIFDINQQKETLIPKRKANLNKLIWIEHKHKTQSNWLHKYSPPSYQYLLEVQMAAI